MTDSSGGQLDEPSVPRPSTEGIQNEGIPSPTSAPQRQSSVMREDRAVAGAQIKHEVIHDQVFVKQEDADESTSVELGAIEEFTSVKQEVVDDRARAGGVASAEDCTSVKQEVPDDPGHTSRVETAAGEVTSVKREVTDDLARAGVTKADWGVLSRPPCKTCHTVHFNACEGPRRAVKREREQSPELKDESDDRAFKRQFATQRQTQRARRHQSGPPRWRFCRRCGRAHPWGRHVQEALSVTAPQLDDNTQSWEGQRAVETSATLTARTEAHETQAPGEITVRDMMTELFYNASSQADLDFLVKYVEQGDDVPWEEISHHWQEMVRVRDTPAASHTTQPVQPIQVARGSRGGRGRGHGNGGHFRRRGRGRGGYPATGGSHLVPMSTRGGRGGAAASQQVARGGGFVGSQAQSFPAPEVNW